jgi:two-component sensor histidine kinase
LLVPQQTSLMVRIAAGGVVFEADLEGCVLPFGKAVPAGLVVDELVTNAAKHAYPEGEEGVVRVTLRTDEVRAEAALTVSDEGRGTTRPLSRRDGPGEGRGSDCCAT